MKTKWKCWVKPRGASDDEEWIEYIHTEGTPQEVIDRFNSTLRPHEHPRELVMALKCKDQDGTPHTWEKFSLVTEAGGYDKYQCKICGAMGKRFGLSDRVIPDKKNQKWCKPK